MTDVLAVYAAVVATAGIGWQAYTWWRDRTVKVAVDVSYGTPVSSGEDLVFITVTNESTFPVSWTQAGMDLQDGTARFALVGLGDKVAAGFELPAVIPSLDSHRFQGSHLGIRLVPSGCSASASWKERGLQE